MKAVFLKRIFCHFIFAGAFFVFCFTEVSFADYQQVLGLMDLRTIFSDGAYDPEYLVQLAKEKGAEALFINDHDRVVMEYGLPPLRNIIKKRVELNSINKIGAEKYLNAIRKVEKKYPDMIIIPGSETTAFYCWSGSPFKKNLVAHNYERRILTVGMEKAEDYENLPILHNGFSTKYINLAFSGIFLSLPFLITAIFLIRRRGPYRIWGVIIFIFGILFIINSKPFRSSPFDQYHGDQGILPYQLLIDYVDSRGGMTFWNYPETRSGCRKMGPIYLNTPPHPQVLEEAIGYTGFAALYGDNTTITHPGNLWDNVLMEYCKGGRGRAPWGIATADFHGEGDGGEKLGNFLTVFFVRKKTKKDILEALRNGKIYACRGNYPYIAKLDEFSVYSPEGKSKGISGDRVVLKGNPRIKISLSAFKLASNHVRVRLIRSGDVIERIEGELPIEIDFEDKYFKPGEMVYYRMDVHGYGDIVSNPIFVEFGK